MAAMTFGRDGTLSRHGGARSPIRFNLIQQPAHFGVALLDQASSFDNQFDTLSEKAGEIARGISVMLGGSGVSLTGGAMTGGCGELCAQPADKVSIVAASSDQASRFEGEGMLCVLLLGSVTGLYGGERLGVRLGHPGALGEVCGGPRLGVGHRGP
jgi:hypothetical protein